MLLGRCFAQIAWIRGNKSCVKCVCSVRARLGICTACHLRPHGVDSLEDSCCPSKLSKSLLFQTVQLCFTPEAGEPTCQSTGQGNLCQLKFQTVPIPVWLGTVNCNLSMVTYSSPLNCAGRSKGPPKVCFHVFLLVGKSSVSKLLA